VVPPVLEQLTLLVELLATNVYALANEGADFRAGQQASCGQRPIAWLLQCAAFNILTHGTLAGIDASG